MISNRLLQPGDVAPFGVENPDGASPILFLSDHAGRAIPQRLGDLGLPEAELARHIGYDIGIYGVTTLLAAELDATYIFQPYSRLVIDCNRRPKISQSVMLCSDGTEVPGNIGLGPEEIAAREDEILRPYQDRIATEIVRRAEAGHATAVFAMHSCTDRLRSDGIWRPWEISVIAETDWRVGNALIEVLREKTGLCVGVNEPYNVNMNADYTVPVHCEGKHIPYVEIEIRQDLIGDEKGQREWAALLAPIFPEAVLRSGILQE